MATVRCAYGKCNTDGRLYRKKVRFFRFPDKTVYPVSCLRWVEACGRPGFGVQDVTKNTYLCSRHFYGVDGPTADHPDPIVATSTTNHNLDDTMSVKDKSRVSKGKSGRQEGLDLFMECEDEELSSSQIAAHQQAESEYEEAIQKINALKSGNVQIIQSNQNSTMPVPVAGPAPVAGMMVGQPMPGQVASSVGQRNLQPQLIGSPRVGAPLAQPQGQQQQYIIQNSMPMAATSAANAGYKLLLDARTGLVIGTVPNDGQPPAVASPTAASNAQQSPSRVMLMPVNPGQVVQRPQIVTLSKANTAGTTTISGGGGPRIVFTTSAVPQVASAGATKVSSAPMPLQLHFLNPGACNPQFLKPEMFHLQPISSQPSALKTVASPPVTAPSRPTPMTAPAVTVKPIVPSSTNNRSRTPVQYPSLTIKVVPQRQAPMTVLQNKKADLDKTMLEVLQQSMTGLVKWMFEHGLFHIKQMCLVHRATPMHLMFDARAEQDRSGGYKWQCPICQCILPIQHRSFFDSLGYGFVVMLKIIYFWACNDDVQKVLKDTQVDACFLRSVFALLRSICSGKVKTLIKLGGTDQRPVEVALIHLSTSCSNASNLYLGCIFERISGLVALRVFQSKQDSKLEEFLQDFVVPSSTVTISRDIKITQSFANKFTYNIIPSSPTISDQGCLILNAMAYIRERVVPIFGSVINQLRVETIQYFLNELMWREKFGTNPYNTFNNILLHIKQHYGTGTANLKSGVQQPVQMPVVTVVSPQTPQASGKVGQPRPLLPKKEEAGPPATPAPNPVSVKRKQEPEESLPPKKVVLLDNHYYSRQAAAPEELRAKENLTKPGFRFKCHVCKKILDNNIKLMRHLYAHIENSKQRNLDLSDLIQCKFCFREFETPYIMQCHVEDVHMKDSNSLTCRICDRAFKDKNTLIDHMYLTHTACEMPYSCAVCKYRCSMYRKIIEHFQQEHCGTNYVQCHYCLRVFSARCSSVQQLGLTNNFWLHIYKHQTKSLSRKCTACCLTFFGQHEMKQHRMYDHVSFQGKPGVSNFPPPEKEREIWLQEPPKERGKFPKPKLLKASGSSIKPSPVKVVTEAIYDIYLAGVEGKKCLECERDMECPEHFTSFVCCSMCRYATNCGKAFAKHVTTRHQEDDSEKKKDSGTAVELPSRVFCVCGYSAVVGNTMADHLIDCGKRSCYPNVDKARSATLESQSASFPPLVVLDEDEEEGTTLTDPSDVWMQSFATAGREEPKPAVTVCEKEEDEVEEKSNENPDMLNILGLMRRPPGKKDVEKSTVSGKFTSDDSNLSNNSVLTDDASLDRSLDTAEETKDAAKQKSIKKENENEETSAMEKNHSEQAACINSPDSPVSDHVIEEIDERSSQLCEEQVSGTCSTTKPKSKSPARRRRRRRRVFTHQKRQAYKITEVTPKIADSLDNHEDNDNEDDDEVCNDFGEIRHESEMESEGDEDILHNESSGTTKVVSSSDNCRIVIKSVKMDCSATEAKEDRVSPIEHTDDSQSGESDANDIVKDKIKVDDGNDDSTPSVVSCIVNGEEVANDDTGGSPCPSVVSHKGTDSSEAGKNT